MEDPTTTTDAITSRTRSGAGHVVFKVDEADQLVSLTPTWSRVTGFGVVRSLGRPLTEFIHVADWSEVEQQFARLCGCPTTVTFNAGSCDWWAVTCRSR